MSNQQHLQQYNGFLPIPIAVSPSTFHYIYVKKHQAKNDPQYADRAIFAVNLPLDTTTNALKNICQQLGNTLLEDYIVDPFSSSRGILVLVDKAACSRFLAKAKKAESNKTANSPTWQSDALTGSALFDSQTQKCLPSHETLKLKADKFMQEFADRERQEAQEVRTLRQKVDDDGFTVVVSSKRKLAAATAAAVSAATTTPSSSLDDLSDTTNSTNKKQTKEKADFYRFQIREQKKHEMNDLLKRFQDDKKKVEEMRQRKRFKPY